MLKIDLTSPPTWQELEEEKQRLQLGQKKLIRVSLLADLMHGLLFLVLYLAQQLSGSGVLTAIVMATLVAVILAARYRNSPQEISWAVVTMVCVASMVFIGFLLRFHLQQPLSGSLAGALISGSVVVIGALLGRKLLQTLLGLEGLKTIVEDQLARQELQWLCHEYPLLAAYRQQATQNLRPNLTYFELQVMREWAIHSPDRSPVLPN